MYRISQKCPQNLQNRVPSGDKHSSQAKKDEIGMTRVNKWNFLIDAIAKKRTVVHYAA